MWIRQGSAGFISAVAGKLNIADIHCNLLPSIQPFLTTKILQIDKEVCEGEIDGSFSSSHMSLGSLMIGCNNFKIKF